MHKYRERKEKTEKQVRKVTFKGRLRDEADGGVVKLRRVAISNSM